MLVVIAEDSEKELVNKLGYSNEDILVTGVGLINVIKALKDIPTETEILNIGYAGSNYYNIGDIVEVESVGTEHNIACFDEPELKLKSIGKYQKVKCYSSNDFVTKTNKDKPCVFDMELATICSLFSNVKSIKIISDKLSYDEFKKV